jgi:hypothetical protein
MTPRARATTFDLLALTLAATAAACGSTSNSNDDDSGSVTVTGGESHECGEAGSNSHVDDGMCICDAGYEWVNPNDDNDFTCEEIGETGSPESCDQPHNVLTGGTCSCEAGYTWCSPDDQDDFSCCEDPAGTETGTVDTGADSTGGSGVEPDPADCNVDSEGAVFCSNTVAMGPEDSRFWTCTGGSWVEDPTAADLQCDADGYDFAYGCFDDGEAIVYLCGNGPGTPCGDEVEATCVNDDVIHACFYGKLTEDGCSTVCSTIGDGDGITYDTGFCDAEAVPVDCFCCDVGDEGCPD